MTVRFVTTRFVTTRRAALVAGLVVAACDEATTPTPTIVPTRVGVAERGGVLAYGVPSDVGTISPVGLEPSDAGVVFAGTDSVRLDRTGRIVVRLEVRASQGRVVNVADTLTAIEPPEIVFDADTAGNRDIWAMRLDGSNRRRITTEPSDDRDPTAAAGQVVFVSGRSGSIELWRAPLAGGPAVQLTTTPEDEAAPAFNGAGDRLAWLTGPAPSLVRVGSATATGGARFAPATTTSANNDEFSPALSFAGDRLAFTTIRSGRPEVWVGDIGGAAGSATRVAGDDTTFNSEPVFSPDGAALLVTRTSFVAGQGDRNDLVLIVPSRSQRVRLTTSGTASQSTWLRDGRVVFRQPTPAGPRLFWVSPDRPTRVVPIPSGGLSPRAVDAVR